MKVSISIDVPNLENGVEFYIQALGCKKLRNMGGNMVILQAGNVEIYIIEKKSGTHPIPNKNITRSFDRHWTAVHLDFLIDDVQGVVKKIIDLGGVHEGGEKGDWGEIAHCADPFGNGFCLIRE